MVDIALLQSLGIIVVAGALFTLLARPAKMPSIVAYLAAGLVLGPATGLVGITAPIDLISHIGIALLLFLVGLEINFEKVRVVGRVVMVAGIGQTALAALGGYTLGLWLGFEMIESVFIGLAVSLSSTVIVVKLLGEKQELNSLHGRIALGVLLVQDLIAIVALTFLSGVDPSGTATPSGIVIGVLRAFAGMSLLLAITLFAARYILPRPFAWAATSPDTLFIASLAWCFLLSFAAEAMHLSLEIGAFLAGIALGQLPYTQDLHRRVHPLMNFFIAVFFVTLGVRMEIHPDSVNWAAAGALALFVLVFKPVSFLAIVGRMGYPARTAFMTGTSMSQISEFSFILLALGITSGQVGAQVLSVTGLVGLITFAASSYVINYSAQLFRFCESKGLFRRFAPRTDDHADADHTERTGHVIVVGMNSLGREIVQRLTALGETVLAIDLNPARLTGLPCDTLLGSVDHLSLLHEAGLPRAKLVVSALMVEEANDLLAWRCSHFGVASSIHAIDLSVIDNLLSANTTYLMIPKVDGIKLQTRELRAQGFMK